MTQTKKILYVITKSNWGGAQRYVYDLATSLPRDQFEPVVACGGNGELVTHLTHAGVRTVTIKSFQRDIALGKDMAAFLELLRLFRAERPHVVHLNSSKAGGVGALAARLAGVPRTIFTAHGWAFNEPRSTVVRGFIWLAHWVTALLCHAVIAVSKRDHAQGAAMPFVAHKMTLIHNGIRPEELLPRKQAQREIFGTVLPAKTLIVGTIAELHPNKGLACGLEAIKSLTDAGIPVVWGIIGTGEARTALLENVSVLEVTNRVVFAGTKERAARYLSAFDVFLLPSAKEGLPYVLLEAGAAHLPIVATNVGGIPEIVADGTTGMLVPPCDAESIVSALKVLAENHALRASLGNRARDTIANSFSFERMFTKTEALYVKE